ncbi:GNAT family N-acetyltransferase [Streptomyces hokutonensis]|uniref:GNAT family N-acetyltransferase n=1 Tax=Streptomyces hokutonensis TaxID=1306990 RepID=UPI0036B78ABB
MTLDNIALRPVDEPGLAVMERFLDDPEAASEFQWYGWSDVRRWRRQWSEDRLLGGDRSYLTVLRAEEPVGFVAWRKVTTTPNCHYWNMGITLLPEARGQGIGTEAQRQLVRYLFAHTLVMRVEADTESENLAEQRALEKAGFTREGVLRSVAYRDGRWRDGVRYSILRDELT